MSLTLMVSYCAFVSHKLRNQVKSLTFDIQGIPTNWSANLSFNKFVWYVKRPVRHVMPCMLFGKIQFFLSLQSKTFLHLATQSSPLPSSLNNRQRNTKEQSRMDNPETQATLCTRQKKTKMIDWLKVVDQYWIPNSSHIFVLSYSSVQ